MSPTLYFLRTAITFMLANCVSIAPSQILNMAWIKLVKNWQNLLSFGLHALKNLGEFPQTESGICIIFRENDYRNI
jgi:hypothetical protein